MSMAERPPSPGQRDLQLLRRTYEELTPPDAMLQRVEARLRDKTSERSDTPSKRQPPLASRRRLTRLLLAALCAGGAAAAAWGLAGGGASAPERQPAPSSGAAGPGAARPAPAARGGSEAAQLAEPSGSKPRSRARPGRPAIPEPRQASGQAPEDPIGARSTGAARILPEPSEGAAPQESDPTLPPAPAGSGNAGSPFFELAPAGGGHGRSLPLDCLGTHDAAAVFPSLGFNAQPVPEHLFGKYTCSISWPSGEPSPAIADTAWSRLHLAAGAGPMVACSSRRGIRIPAHVSLPAFPSDAPIEGNAEVLLQDQQTFSLSFRARAVDSSPAPRNPTADGRQNSFSILVTAGPLRELTEHGVLRATLLHRSAGGLPLRGQLECHQVK